jgi:hypothetical protein
MPLYKSDGITEINTDKIAVLPDTVTGKFLCDDGQFKVVTASPPDPVVTALGTTGAIAVPMATADVFTITPTGACTFTTTSFKNGKRVTFMVLTSGTTARVLTWSTGFKPLSTLSTGTVTGKRFSQTFYASGIFGLKPAQD